MHGERGVAGEGLATATLVGPLARVDAKVVGEVRALVAHAYGPVCARGCVRSRELQLKAL